MPSPLKGMSPLTCHTTIKFPLYVKNKSPEYLCKFAITSKRSVAYVCRLSFVFLYFWCFFFLKLFKNTKSLKNFGGSRGSKGQGSNPNNRINEFNLKKKTNGLKPPTRSQFSNHDTFFRYRLIDISDTSIPLQVTSTIPSHIPEKGYEEPMQHHVRHENVSSFYYIYIYTYYYFIYGYMIHIYTLYIYDPDTFKVHLLSSLFHRMKAWFQQDQGSMAKLWIETCLKQCILWPSEGSSNKGFEAGSGSRCRRSFLVSYMIERIIMESWYPEASKTSQERVDRISKIFPNFLCGHFFLQQTGKGWVSLFFTSNCLIFREIFGIVLICFIDSGWQWL